MCECMKLHQQGSKYTHTQTHKRVGRGLVGEGVAVSKGEHGGREKKDRNGENIEKMTLCRKSTKVGMHFFSIQPHSCHTVSEVNNSIEYKKRIYILYLHEYIIGLFNSNKVK